MMLDRIREPYSDAAAEQSADSEREHVHDAGRRRFSRTALAGSAVLLSLGNRSAWGQTVGCMSVMTLNSFNPDTQMFASYHAARPEHDTELAGHIHNVGTAPPDFVGGVADPYTVDGMTGKYLTCEEPGPGFGDRVCLVKGDSCPPL